MDKNRFKRVSVDSARAKRSVPKLDEMGELRIVDGEKEARVKVPSSENLQDSSKSTVSNLPVSNPEPAPKDYIAENVTGVESPNKTSKTGTEHSVYEASQMQAASSPLMAATTASPMMGQSAPQETNINININLPKIPKFNLKRPVLPALPNLPYKKTAIYGSIALASAAAVAVTIILVTHHSVKPKPVVSSTSNSPKLGLRAPTFTPLAPKDKPQLAKGIEGTTFDGSRDSYSYTDVLNGTPLVVSQQPIPSKYNSAIAAVQAAAKSIGATTNVPANNAQAYMVTNTKSQSQVIVFSMKNILLFIQSYFTHPASLWADYINNLQ